MLAFYVLTIQINITVKLDLIQIIQTDADRHSEPLISDHFPRLNYDPGSYVDLMLIDIQSLDIGSFSEAQL
jgi:hypothetical protein